MFVMVGNQQTTRHVQKSQIDLKQPKSQLLSILAKARGTLWGTAFKILLSSKHEANELRAEWCLKSSLESCQTLIVLYHSIIQLGQKTNAAAGLQNLDADPKWSSEAARAQPPVQ